MKKLLKYLKQHDLPGEAKLYRVLDLINLNLILECQPIRNCFNSSPTLTNIVTTGIIRNTWSPTSPDSLEHPTGRRTTLPTLPASRLSSLRICPSNREFLGKRTSSRLWTACSCATGTLTWLTGFTIDLDLVTPTRNNKKSAIFQNMYHIFSRHSQRARASLFQFTTSRLSAYSALKTKTLTKLNSKKS